MLDINTICIVGGDRRQAILGRLLSAGGKAVSYFALEKLGEAQPDFASLRFAAAKCGAVILPAPLTRDGKTLGTPLSDLQITLGEEFGRALSGKVVFCANKELLMKLCAPKDAVVFDYLADETLAAKNAALTAEGALAAAINASDTAIFGSRCLVAGCGRIGKLLAHRLSALGADVTVSARRESDLAMIRAFGLKAAETGALASSGEQYDFIFNTIPAPVFGEKELLATARGVVIDLASKPGGVDLEACRHLGINGFSAPGLPGKTAPETAARIIRDTIYRIMEEYP